MRCEVRVDPYVHGAAPSPQCPNDAVWAVDDKCPGGWTVLACAEHEQRARDAFPEVKVRLLPQKPQTPA